MSEVETIQKEKELLLKENQELKAKYDELLGDATKIQKSEISLIEKYNELTEEYLKLEDANKQADLIMKKYKELILSERSIAEISKKKLEDKIEELKKENEELKKQLEEEREKNAEEKSKAKN